MIVCGYNEITKNLKGKFVDTNFDREDENFIWGNPEDPDILKRAGIEKEDTVIIATGDDSRNIYITLIARNLNPLINIGVVLKKQENMEKAYKAGANNVLLESEIVGREILNALLNPKASELLNMVIFSESLNLYAIQVPARYVGRRLRDTDIRKRIGMVIAIKRGEKIIKNPSPSTILHRGDLLIFFKT